MRTKVDHIISKWPYLPLFALVLFGLSYLFVGSISERTSVNRERKNLEEFVQKQERDFESLLGDTARFNRLLSGNTELADMYHFSDKPYGVYLFVMPTESTGEMTFWNRQSVVPPASFHTLPDGRFFRQLDNGYYVCIKRSFNQAGLPLVIYGLIPVQYKYFVRNNYLPQDFVTGPKGDERISIAGSTTDFPVNSISGNPLFYLEAKTKSIIVPNAGWLIGLRLAAVFFLLLYCYLMAERLIARKGLGIGIGFFISSLLLLRLITYFAPFPFELRQFPLFDPATYASTPVMKSLGDLLINSVLFWWISTFTWSKIGIRSMERKEGLSAKDWVWGTLAIAGFVFFTFYTANVTRSLVADSQISFQVTDVFSLTVDSIVGFVILAAISLGYFYLSKLLFKYIYAVFDQLFFAVFGIIAFTGLLYLTISFGNPLTHFYLKTLIWMVGYAYLLYRKDLFFNRFHVSIAGVLFWIFVFSVSNAAVMMTENAKKEFEKRKALAQRISITTDPTTERTLSIALTYIDNEFLTRNFSRFFNETDNAFLRDSILKSSGYLNIFDTRLFVFDNQGRGLYNEENQPFNTLNTIFTVQAKPTNTPGFFYYDNSYDRFTYIIRREITTAEGQLEGYMFIVSNPKQYSSDALYPELFRDKSYEDISDYSGYPHAVYKQKNLISPFNKYPFPTSLSESEIPRTEFDERVNGAYDELWYRAGAEKVVVIARKQESIIEGITLFSWLFCVFLLLVSLLRLISLLIIAVYRRKELKQLFQLNIRTQVHSIVILISLISFLVIGIVTIRFFINRFERSNSDKLSRTMGIMVREMQKRLADHRMFDDVISIDDSLSNSGIQDLVKEVAEIHNVDVNVYDLRGNLSVTSQPLVYNEGFLSKKMDPVAFYHLSRLKQIPYVQRERLGTLSYSSIYAPVRNESGRVESYLNIPYFLSQRELNQEISNFLITIINLNAFIFLIAGAIALFITNRITSSFLLISERMQEINLGKTNEEIDWKRDDEIGGLVKEYNKMVKKLEESASALAKSEREGAWREMARQVAHEIKNPLTPMKLSIQYLQKAINNNTDNVKELSASVARTLVEQIDHLSKIAADFSQFANIGNLNIEYFDLHEVLAPLCDLYKTNTAVHFEWEPVHQKLLVRADRTQMNRLFTNLFQNAIEASTSSAQAHIHISEVLGEGKVTIQVRDNGEGIPLEMQSKIFIPNFTTKSSGTGLGLAMCKTIVEQAGGEIRFETVPGDGTVFFVELPLLN